MSTSQTTSVGTAAVDFAPGDFALRQNYPNPFNPTTTIRFTIPREAGTQAVELTVFDLMGRKVRSLVNRALLPGTYAVAWDGLDDRGIPVAAGTYFYRIKAGSFKAVKRMILAK